MQSLSFSCGFWHSSHPGAQADHTVEGKRGSQSVPWLFTPKGPCQFPTFHWPRPATWPGKERELLAHARKENGNQALWRAFPIVIPCHLWKWLCGEKCRCMMLGWALWRKLKMVKGVKSDKGYCSTEERWKVHLWWANLIRGLNGIRPASRFCLCYFDTVKVVGIEA